MSAPRIADRLSRRLTWKDLDQQVIRQWIEIARKEDLEGYGLASTPSTTGDVTSSILDRGNTSASASLVARESLTVCGLPLVPLILEAYCKESSFESFVVDGMQQAQGDVLGTISGPARQLLEAERIILNFLQRLSGIATLTSQYVKALEGSSTRLLDTRKTTPGFRVLEKYAVACGGGYNHRIGLFDRVMLKDNHLAAENAVEGKALTTLVQQARENWPDLPIELEVDDIAQIQPALEACVDVILLDNFSIPDLTTAISLIGDQAATEASGGINLDSLPALAPLGLDFISTGATIHQATWKDIGLDWN